MYGCHKNPCLSVVHIDNINIHYLVNIHSFSHTIEKFLRNRAKNAILWKVPKGVFTLKYIKQFAIIAFISLIGEALNHLIPLPIPASIYGVVILFLCLETKIIPLSAVKETGLFLVSLMQIMFIPATVGLIDTWGVFAPNWIAYTVIIVVSTFAVMLVSGKATEWCIILSKKKEEKKQ